MSLQIKCGSAFPPLSESEIRDLESEILTTYPHPLALSYRNVIEAKDPVAQVTLCISDLLSTIYQYLALVMLLDYASLAVTRSYRLYGFIEEMVYRAGPGKWLGFLRESLRFYREKDLAPSITEIPTFFDMYGRSKRSHLELVDENTSSKHPALDALVALRNRWAHARNLAGESAPELASSLLLVVRHLMRDLACLRQRPLLAVDATRQLTELAGVNLPSSVTSKPEPLEVYLGSPESPSPSLRLFLQRGRKKDSLEVLLFEELIGNRQAVYSSSFSSLRMKRSTETEQAIVEGMAELIEHLRSEDETLTLKRTTFDRFAARCNAFTRGVYTEFKDAGKYYPDAYVPPAPLSGSLQAFLESDATLHLIAGDQGGGKSALVCHWARELLGEDRAVSQEPEASNELEQHAVLLLEAHRANVYEHGHHLLERWMADTLHLDASHDPLQYIEAALQKASESQGVLLIFDAINEFEKMSEGRRMNCRRLLAKLIDLAERIHDTPHLRGRVRMILTLRWDAFAAVDYTVEEFASEYADRTNLFYQTAEGHQLCSWVPPLSDPGEIYEHLRRAGQGMAPQFSWSEVPAGLRHDLTNPMLLRLFMTIHDGATADEIRATSLRQLEDAYLRRLFESSRKDAKEVREQKRQRADLVVLILKLMKQAQTLHLRLIPTEEARLSGMTDLLKKIFDRKRVQDGTPVYQPYEDLVACSILREEMVRASMKGESLPVPVKRVSFTHELIARYLVLQAQAIEKKVQRGTTLVSYGLLAGFLMAGVAYIASMLGWKAALAMLVGTLGAVPGGLLAVIGTGMRNRVLDSVDARLQGRPDVMLLFRKHQVATKLKASHKLAYTLSASVLMGPIAYFWLGYFNKPYLPHVFVVEYATIAVVLYSVGLAVYVTASRCYEALVSGDLSLMKHYGSTRYQMRELFDAAYAVVVVIGSLVTIYVGVSFSVQLASRVPCIDVLLNEPLLRELLWFPNVLLWPWFIVLLVLLQCVVNYGFLWWSRRSTHAQSASDSNLNPRSRRGRWAIVAGFLVFTAFAQFGHLFTFKGTLSFGAMAIPIHNEMVFQVDRDNDIHLYLTPADLGGKEEAQSVTSLESLRGLNRIWSVTLEGTAVDDLAPLASLPRLYTLTLIDNRFLCDLGGLSEAESRPRVTIKNSPCIEDLSVVDELGVPLVLEGAWVTDEVLRTWRPKYGRSLTLVETSVTGLDVLKRPENIVHLSLVGGPALDSSAGLTRCVNLRELKLQGECYSGLPRLPKNASLHSLVLCRTGIADLSPLLTIETLAFLTLVDHADALDAETIEALRARGVNVVHN